MANWATEAEALAITGESVTDAQITVAQGVIDIHSGTQIEALANLTTRDRRLLRYAVAYQAVFMADQIDALTRVNVAEMNQDGVRVKPAGPLDLTVAPHAQTCLGQLSWKRARSVSVQPGGAVRYASIEALQAAFLRDETDAGLDWRPA